MEPIVTYMSAVVIKDLKGYILFDNNYQVIQKSDLEYPHIGIFTNAKYYIRHLISIRNVSMDKLNEYLVDKRFPYIVVSYKENETEHQAVKLKSSVYSFSIDCESLSPGEKITILSLLLDFELTYYPSINTIRSGSLLLLDEPDAHLHPSLVKDLFNMIIKLIKVFGIQIIMTTHNPETVALIPLGHKQCRFLMDIDDTTALPYIEQIESKNQALQLLTANVIPVNESFRMVFVESANDRIFFEFINSYLIQHKYVRDVLQLLFKYYSTNAKAKFTTELTDTLDNYSHTSSTISRRFTSKETEMVKRYSAVQRLVRKFPNPPVKTFVYGVISYFDKQFETANVFSTKRRSIAHYILDPIHVGYSLSRSDIKLAHINTVTLQQNCSRAMRQNLKSTKQNYSNDSFQKIIDYISNLLFAQSDLDKKTPVVIAFNLGQGITLSYPAKFFDMTGNDLMECYRELNVNVSLTNVYKFLIDIDDMIVTEDLLDVYRQLHSYNLD